MLQTNALPASAGFENPERPFGFAELLRLLRQLVDIRGRLVQTLQRRSRTGGDARDLRIRLLQHLLRPR